MVARFAQLQKWQGTRQPVHAGPREQPLGKCAEAYRRFIAQGTDLQAVRNACIRHWTSEQQRTATNAGPSFPAPEAQNAGVSE
jgi:hypothetical protein